MRCVEVKPSTSSCRARRSSSLLLQMIRNLPRELFWGCRGWLIDILVGALLLFTILGGGRRTVGYVYNQLNNQSKRPRIFFIPRIWHVKFFFYDRCCGMPDFHRKSMAAPDHCIPSQNSLFSFNSLYDLIPYEDLTHINMAIHRAAPPAEPSSPKIFRDSLCFGESIPGELGEFLPRNFGPNCHQTGPGKATTLVDDPW